MRCLRLSFSLLIGAGFILRVAALPSNSSRPTATIASGVVVGLYTVLPSASVTVSKYLGIPFALSPPERFSPPSDPRSWTVPLDTSVYKPACVQQFNYPPATQDFNMYEFNNPGGPPPAESEDCLYLNVFTPTTKAPATGRAVMVWVFGGGLQFGNGGLLYYDGSSFAANQDVIIVTPNYRTNVFGFPNSPEIPIDQQNAGFLDQRKALTWVQQNIAAFGGDPAKVTIFGESAGGYSVKQLLANPPDPLPYRAAIMESQATEFIGNSTANWETLGTELGCTSDPSMIDCMRRANATQIKNIIETQVLDFAPVYNNLTAVSNVGSTLESRRFAQVPFMIGTNAQEGRSLISPNTTVDEFLNAQFPGQTALQNAVLAAYPEQLRNHPFFFNSQVITDFLMLCHAFLVANNATANGYDVWRYWYNASFPNLASFPSAGVYHFSEIPIVWGTYPGNNQFGNVTQQEIQLSKYMQSTWANFAKDPSAGPSWPRLGTNNGTELGDIGANGSDGERTIPLESVDHICGVYESFIIAEGF